jgi:hypothetical protein
MYVFHDAFNIISVFTWDHSSQFEFQTNYGPSRLIYLRFLRYWCEADENGKLKNKDEDKVKVEQENRDLDFSESYDFSALCENGKHGLVSKLASTVNTQKLFEHNYRREFLAGDVASHPMRGKMISITRNVGTKEVYKFFFTPRKETPESLEEKRHSRPFAGGMGELMY